ncbi:hypothetical protein SUDANB66_00548 [Streptomyces sp. SudanB66_2053]
MPVADGLGSAPDFADGREAVEESGLGPGPGEGDGVLLRLGSTP